MSISLSKFIENLEEVNRIGLVNITKQEITDIFFDVLYEMSLLTITDTGQARSVIIDDFAKSHGKNVDELFTEYYDFWSENGFEENWMRGRGEGRTRYREVANKDSRIVHLQIKDEGLYAQEHADGSGVFQGRQYPSEVHSKETGRDNNQFRIHHITHVSDNWQDILGIEILFKQITNKIAERLFKK
jgi:hypothetical protein